MELAERDVAPLAAHHPCQGDVVSVSWKTVEDVVGKVAQFGCMRLCHVRQATLTGSDVRNRWAVSQATSRGRRAAG